MKNLFYFVRVVLSQIVTLLCLQFIIKIQFLETGFSGGGGGAFIPGPFTCSHLMTSYALSFQSIIIIMMMIIIIIIMSLVTGKPAFGVFDQVRLKQACSATETS